VLDLPEAVAAAALMLAAEGLGDRVTHVAGDARCADLGRERYDLIVMSNLAHHLDDAANRDFAVRARRALTPGGVYVVQEPVRPDHPDRAGQTGALLGLYFAMQSRPGVRTWTVAEMTGWLAPRRPVRLRTAPGWVQISGRRRG